MRTWRTDQLLWLLRFLRLVVALTSTSLIARRPRSSLASRCLTPSQHPDEHFQNSEVAADLVFDFPYRLARTWEWQPEHPCRSIVPVWLSTGWAFALLRCFVDVPSARSSPSIRAASLSSYRRTHTAAGAARRYVGAVGGGRSVVRSRRRIGLISSAELAADRISPRATRSKLLFSASLGGLAFLCRPLSNSLAALLLVPLFASAEVIVRSSLSSARDPVSSRYLDGFWMLLALGIWCRVDFIAFALPSVVQVGLACLSPGYVQTALAGVYAQRCAGQKVLAPPSVARAF
jgi:phosphatidylinositol glycan class Z